MAIGSADLAVVISAARLDLIKRMTKSETLL